MMTKSELITRLHNHLKMLTHTDVNMSINVILDTISKTLSSGGKIEIRGFGSFRLNTRPPRIARNPKTGDKVEVLETKVPSFKPGIGLRQRVNKSE